MSKVVPIKAGFENPKAFLLYIAEDEEIESCCVIVMLKDGTMLPAQDRHPSPFSRSAYLDCAHRDAGICGGRRMADLAGVALFILYIGIRAMMLGWV